MGLMTYPDPVAVTLRNSVDGQQIHRPEDRRARARRLSLPQHYLICSTQVIPRILRHGIEDRRKEEGTKVYDVLTAA
jgi:hypothetical protein